MKLAALALLLFAAVPPRPELRYFHYGRAVQVAASAQGQSCVPLDAEVFANAAPGLSDLRLYAGDAEVPFALRTAQAPETASRPVMPLNVGVHAGRTEFDAAMPARTYSDVELQITEQNFQAKVEVSGSQTAGSSDSRRVGTYTIFDLTKEKSGRNTVLHLPVSDYRYLHFAIDGPIAPDAVTGITVLPTANMAEPAYTTVAQSTIAIHSGRATTLTFAVPAHVPVDRVLFQPGGSPVHFVRSVTIKVTAASHGRGDDEEAFQPASFTGTLLRLQETRDGVTSHEENDAVSTSGWAFDKPQTWTVVVDNGDDQPLQLGAVRLQMLEREVCFQSTGPSAYVLRYGDAALPPPRYDYALASAKGTVAAATLGPEQANSAWVARPDERPFTERHPLLLWVALVAVMAVLGAVALRSRPRQGR